MNEETHLNFHLLPFGWFIKDIAATVSKAMAKIKLLIAIAWAVEHVRMTKLNQDILSYMFRQAKPKEYR